MDANTNPIELCGTVAAVIYQNEENGYTVLKLDAVSYTHLRAHET